MPSAIEHLLYPIAGTSPNARIIFLVKRHNERSLCDHTWEPNNYLSDVRVHLNYRQPKNWIDLEVYQVFRW